MNCTWLKVTTPDGHDGYKCARCTTFVYAAPGWPKDVECSKPAEVMGDGLASVIARDVLTREAQQKEYAEEQARIEKERKTEAQEIANWWLARRKELQEMLLQAARNGVLGYEGTYPCECDD